MIRFTLRLSEELHDALKKIADKEHRSIHAQIIHVLTQYVMNELQGTKQG